MNEPIEGGRRRRRCSTQALLRLRYRRFMERVECVDLGCWRWKGYILKTGYGSFGSAPAHRVSYELFVGPIQPGYHIDHLCRTRACVNPYHLESVTQRENTLRSDSPNAIAVRTNRCKRGHELVNPVITSKTNPKKTGRACRVCVNAYNRKKWHERASR